MKLPDNITIQGNPAKNVETLRVPGGWGSQISRQSAHEDSKVVSPTHRQPGTHFCYRLSQLEELCQWKIPVIPLGIQPSTFRLVAQCLNQLRHCMPPAKNVISTIFWIKVAKGRCFGLQHLFQVGIMRKISRLWMSYWKGALINNNNNNNNNNVLLYIHIYTHI
jgi:hypothetical protein